MFLFRLPYRLRRMILYNSFFKIATPFFKFFYFFLKNFSKVPGILILCGFPAFFSYTVKQIFIFQVHSDILFYVPSSDYTSLRQPHEAMYPDLPYHDSGELLQFRN